MNTLIFTILTLCAIGVVAAVILYFVAQKFKVEEEKIWYKQLNPKSQISELTGISLCPADI